MGSRKDRAAKAARRAAHAARTDHRGQDPRPSEQRAGRKAQLKVERKERRRG